MSAARADRHRRRSGGVAADRLLLGEIKSGMIGPAIASAACEAENAFRAMARMTLHLDAAHLEVTDEVAEVIADVADIASGLIVLADGIGSAAVERRAAR
jgi:hypothetical protein